MIRQGSRVCGMVSYVLTSMDSVNLLPVLKNAKKKNKKKIGIFWYNVPYFIPVNVWLCLAFTKNNKLVIMHIVTCYFVESVCRLRRYTYRKHQSTDRSAAGHQMSDFPSGSRQCAFLDEQQYGPVINNQSITSH